MNSFDLLGHLNLASISFQHASSYLSKSFLTFWHLKMFYVHCMFSWLVLESSTSLRIPVSFYWRKYLETMVWLDVLTSASSPFSRQHSGMYACILFWAHTHLSLHFLKKPHINGDVSYSDPMLQGLF
jgi:hypothetical protein